MYNFILRGFEPCKPHSYPSKVVVIYFDVQKAFDTVSHEKLLKIVEKSIYLPAYFLQFLRFYLTDRYMKVRVGSVLSKNLLWPLVYPKEV